MGIDECNFDCMPKGDSIRPAIPAEGGMNINALVRIPTNAVALLNRLFRTITHETVRRVTAPRI